MRPSDSRASALRQAIFPMKTRAWIQAAVFAGCIACDHALSHHPVLDPLGSRTGEPWSAMLALVSFSGLLHALCAFIKYATGLHRLGTLEREAVKLMEVVSTGERSLRELEASLARVLVEFEKRLDATKADAKVTRAAFRGKAGRRMKP